MKKLTLEELELTVPQLSTGECRTLKGGSGTIYGGTIEEVVIVAPYPTDPDRPDDPYDDDDPYSEYDGDYDQGDDGQGQGDGQNNEFLMPNLPSFDPLMIPGMNTCAPSALQFISQMLGNTINQGVFIQWLSENLGVNVFENGISWEQTVSLASNFFTAYADGEHNMLEAFENGWGIMGMIGEGDDWHAIVIVGYTSDHQFIYYDPELGGTDYLDFNDLNGFIIVH